MKMRGFAIDPTEGPLVYQPYAGGNRFKNETLTEKPGFKIWVDGGVLDYELEGSPFLQTCIQKSLDCSATCCMQSYCAPQMGLCLRFRRRAYAELYIGFFVVTMIVAGVPTMIALFEWGFSFKFCQYYDEEMDAYLGGMTTLEFITWMCTCGKSAKGKDSDKDPFITEFL